MADNVAVAPATGTGAVPVATDEQLDGSHVQVVKPAFGGDGVATMVSAADPLPVNPIPLATVTTRRVSVPTPGARVRLPAAACSSVTLRARPGNAGIVYVGGADVDAANGFELAAGDAVALDVDDTSAVWIDGSVPGVTVSYIWVV
ncbi:MAG: hypothetical protein M3N52_12120 [Actinomycetota bacterium]|nr:hypothetical protein [Actinomycetota bacterium]